MEKLLESANIFYNAGDKKQAFEIYRKILSQNTNVAEAWYGIALCIYDIEKKEYCLQRAIRINPEFVSAKKLLYMLYELKSNSLKSELNTKPLREASPQSANQLLKPNLNAQPSYHYEEIKINKNLDSFQPLNGVRNNKINQGVINNQNRGKKNKSFWALFIICISIFCIVSFLSLLGVLQSPNSQGNNSSSSSSSSSLVTIGTWYDTWAVPRTITITKLNGTYYIKSTYSDGSGDTKSLEMKYVDGERRFIENPNSRYGDYFVINGGSLSFYDNQGIIYSISP